MIEEFISLLGKHQLADVIDQFKAEVLETTFESGPGEPNLITTTIKLEDKFYQIEQESPATEWQLGRNFSTNVYEVHPYPITTVTYKVVGNTLASWSHKIDYGTTVVDYKSNGVLP